MPGNDSGHVAPDWLHVAPREGLVSPNAETTIQLTAYIHSGSGAILHHLMMDSGSNIDAILILHLAGGSDHFVAVDAQLEPTCVGADVDVLLALDGKGDSSRW